MLLFPNLAFIMRIQGGIQEWMHSRWETLLRWSISKKQIWIPKLPLFTHPCGGVVNPSHLQALDSGLVVHLSTEGRHVYLNNTNRGGKPGQVDGYPEPTPWDQGRSRDFSRRKFSRVYKSSLQNDCHVALNLFSGSPRRNAREVGSVRSQGGRFQYI